MKEEAKTLKVQLEKLQKASADFEKKTSKEIKHLKIQLENTKKTSTDFEKKSKKLEKPTGKNSENFNGFREKKYCFFEEIRDFFKRLQK